MIPRVLGFVLLLAGFSLRMAGQGATAAEGQLVLMGGTVYPSPTEDPIRDGVVLIREGKIAAVGRRGAVPIPESARTLDCTGLTITAGFWNSHVHLGERKWADGAKIPAPELAGQLQNMLTRYGFTSVFDLGSPWQNTRRIRERIESGEVPGPRIRSTGEMVLGKGFAPPEAMVRALGSMVFPQPEVTNAAEALAAAKQHLDDGTDGLKMYAASAFPPFTPLPDEVIRTAVEEAHRRGKPVFAHPQGREGLLAAVRGGVDVIAHTTPPSGPWDEALVAEMRRANVALIPTLKVWKYVLRHERDSLADSWTRNSLGQLRAWLASGGTVLFGTDVGDYDPSDEYALMSEAGMTFRQILASLTTAPAAKFGESARLGRIAPGLVADLVVLNGDPSRDVRTFAAVRYTIRDGKVIYQSAR
jgi:imidazolonepropionase-like amidohydrolase